MIIKIQTLVHTWKECGYGKEEIKEETNRLYNALRALKENDLISRKVFELENAQLQKAINRY